MFHFSICSLAQVGIGEKKIDSLIANHEALLSNDHDKVVYYIYSTFDIRSGLYLIDINNNYFKYILDGILTVEGKIRKRTMAKLRIQFEQLRGEKASIVFMEDGCEGKMQLYHKSNLVYTQYFLGNVPNEIVGIDKIVKKLIPIRAIRR
jgi:hypothetical protein